VSLGAREHLEAAPSFFFLQQKVRKS